MNKIAVCLVGLAILSQSSVALAAPGWMPTLNQVMPSTDLAQSSASPFTEQATAEAIPAAIPNAELPATSELPNSPTASARPIATDLGVEFNLSNSDAEQASPNQTAATPDVAQSPPVAPPPTASPIASPLPINPPVAQFDTAKIGDFTLSDLFTGNSDSLVAVAVGSAEGTRTPDGGRNKAFYGHTDPGNGVWNLGTFSYQHGATSADAADAKQLDRLMQQAQVMQDKAAQKGIKLTLEEALNGIDLANQAPKALLDSVGYIEWLSEAYTRGMNGPDAILWARVQSFFDPKTQRWNAPGLGNTPDRITHDQQRRMQAIARAIDAKNYHISSDARLRPQSMSFRLPRWNFVSQAIHKLAMLLNRQ